MIIPAQSPAPGWWPRRLEREIPAMGQHLVAAKLAGRRRIIRFSRERGGGQAKYEERGQDGLHALSRSNTRMTWPPRAVGTPASFSPAAMALRLVFPAAYRSLMIGAISGLGISARLQGLYGQCTSLLARDYATIATQLRPSPLARCQRGIVALADHPTPFVGNHGHDPHCQPVGIRHVGIKEVNAGLFQAQQEVSIARKPVQLGNDELGAVDPAGLDRFRKLWPIRVLSALNFHELLHNGPIAVVQALGDRIALRLDAKPGFCPADRSKHADS